MFKSVIFDFGNVLVKFAPEYITAPYIPEGEDAEDFNAVFFDRLYWDKLDDGSLDDETAKNLICSRLPERLHGAARKAFDSWHLNLPYIKGMFEIVSELKSKGVRLVLLSDISAGFAEKYCESTELASLFDMFDGLVFSGKIHITKPSREVFEFVIDRFDIDTADCIFIDDRQENLDGAELVGIKGYLFDGDSEKLREYLFR